MMRLVPHPYTEELARDWIASHVVEREAGTAHRFAVEDEGGVVGTCDVDEIAGGVGDLGYWFDEAVWGRGYATEAASAVVDFSFGSLGLSKLTSGHVSDNPVSGRVLDRLGFERTGEARIWSMPRACEIVQIKYALPKEAWRSRAG